MNNPASPRESGPARPILTVWVHMDLRTLLGAGGRTSRFDLHFQTERVHPATRLSYHGIGLQGFSVSSR